MAHTTITASDSGDLVNQLDAFEQNLASTGEVIDYQIPVLNSLGVIDNSDGPDCGATGNVQESRRALVSYFNAWAFQPQPVQAKILRLNGGQISDWLSFDDAAAFAADSPLVVS